MEHFFLTVSRYANLSIQSRQALTDQLQKQALPKGAILVKPDTTCKYLYFIESGLTRTFYLKDGKDVTDWISDAHSFACSVISFITKTPDRRGIELLEDAVLYALHRDALDTLCARHHDIETLFSRLVSLGLVQLQQKFDDLHFADARERYLRLMQTNPSFIQRVPLGMIASYLGITRETLSRIRAQR